MIVYDIIVEVAADLNDTDFDRWTITTWERFLNSGERQLIVLKPTAYTLTRVVELSEGARQSLPDGTSSHQSPAGVTHERAVELQKITRNMGTDGATSGAPVYHSQLKDIDDLVPDWRSATASATVVNYMFDPDDRTVFEVYPPQPSSSNGWVEIVYSAIPTEISQVSESMHLGAEYAEPLKNYMKHRAYSMNAAHSQRSAEKALYHWELFLTQIGRKDMIEQKYIGREINGD